MYPINIYALTRTGQSAFIQKMEKQMSKRSKPLLIRKWEIESLRSFSENLTEHMAEAASFTFYYSFQIPKLGKEFDLLRISEQSVVNIELKSNAVSMEKIRKQLLQNRYYLASLGKTVRSYTYVSSSQKLFRLTNSNKLIESGWNQLCKDFSKQEGCYHDHIEDLFREELYLISPLTDPDRFLCRDYFLTFQQKDIKNHMIHNIRTKNSCFQGFTGLPGTGKTLLLYDMALHLSEKQRVLILNFGEFPKEIEQLKKRLKRIDFYSFREENNIPDFSAYSVILVDQSHQMPPVFFHRLREYGIAFQKNLIFTYDLEDAISPDEQSLQSVSLLHSLPDFQEFRLTNRIRMNSELSSFIHNMMNRNKYHRRTEYPSISLSLANKSVEVHRLLQFYMENDYMFLSDETIPVTQNLEFPENSSMKACVGMGKDFEKVVMLIDESFYYDGDGYLRCKDEPRSLSAVLKEETFSVSRVRTLFHGLYRAKREIAVIVFQNEEVFSTLLCLLQS